MNLQIKWGTNMVRFVSNRNIIASFLSIVLLLGMFGGMEASAQRRHRRHHHSTKKGALIGGGAGLVTGALVGGKKGALIGAGAGAGTGYLIQRHRNRRHRRRNY
jgi:osmotically inducible lipoprotein OsmB